VRDLRRTVFSPPCRPVARSPRRDDQLNSEPEKARDHDDHDYDADDVEDVHCHAPVERCQPCVMPNSSRPRVACHESRLSCLCYYNVGYPEEFRFVFDNASVEQIIVI
jgi:hypothetical protein